MRNRHFAGISFLAFICLAGGAAQQARAQSDSTRVSLPELAWRNVGPFRGGRTRALEGVPAQPNVFYVAQVNGGVWKTTDYGHTWNPIFDREETGSVGAISIARSNPNIIYVGSGEGLHRPDLSTGDGIYKSVDGGRSWTHLGLRDGQQIPRIAVDPRDPNRLFVAVLGHPYGPDKERGLYRSKDGGQTFQRVLDKGEDTGANDVVIDPSQPDVIYTSFWEDRQGPWENADWSGTAGGIFKSTDGGDTWRKLTTGLPDNGNGVVQANLAVAPSDSKRIYAAVARKDGTGIFVSNDAGESWTNATSDSRPAERIGGGDLNVLAVDPQNPGIVYSASTVTWKSVDGAKTWTALRGAPGGDDYQGIWINPDNPKIILLVSDQGAIVTVNGGDTWSGWYNQPTAQIYHVAADNAFPYRICGGQQESGSVCISSRGNDGEITMREWHPVGAEEYGYVVPDPLDPDIVYGGKLTRYDRRTGQVQDVSPRPVRGPGYRVVRTQPVVFSPLNPHILYMAANTVWKTANGGRTWTEISPDLTRKSWDVPASVGKYRGSDTARPAQRGVVYTLAPSPLAADWIWAGTDDGLVQVTNDGGAHWADVTPKQLVPWAKVSIIEAGHFDRATAYAAVNTIRLDDLRPHIFRTHDSGKTWTEITSGLPDGATINVVREDPKRKGLLFAGSERAVYVSGDDGDHWQSLRLNMPATSVRDLLIKGDDLIAATHGRGFWILDDIAPLRELTPAVTSSPAFLFEPQTAMRVRWNMNTDTPLPPDFPAGQNPPDGAVIDYFIGPTAGNGEVKLEILDSANHVVRTYSSKDAVPAVDPALAIPAYWLRPPQPLSNAPGFHRFLWDMHYPRLPVQVQEYPIAAVPHNTQPSFNSPWVMPGPYTVKLTAGGKEYTQALLVRMDPRVQTSRADLARQWDASKRIYDDLTQSTVAAKQIESLRQQLKPVKSRIAKAAELDNKLADILGEAAHRHGPQTSTLTSLNTALLGLLDALQSADLAPTAQQTTAAAERSNALAELMKQWDGVKGHDLPALNSLLPRLNAPELKLPSVADLAAATAAEAVSVDKDEDLP